MGGEGRTSHIKVAQKLDMMGIGAAHQKDPNGIAWKQNKDFESLLKRLNEANGMGEGGGEDGSVVDGFVKQKGDVEEKEGDVEEKEGEKEKKKKEKKEKDGGEKKKKRKRDRGGEEAEGKSKKKRKRDNEKVETITPPQSKPAVEEKPAHIVPRHRSYVKRLQPFASLGILNSRYVVIARAILLLNLSPLNLQLQFLKYSELHQLH